MCGSERNSMNAHLSTIYPILTTIHSVMDNHLFDLIVVHKVNFPPVTGTPSGMCASSTESVKDNATIRQSIITIDIYNISNSYLFSSLYFSMHLDFI